MTAEASGEVQSPAPRKSRRIQIICVLLAISALSWFGRFDFSIPQPTRLVGHLIAFSAICAATLLWRRSPGGRTAFIVWSVLVLMKTIIDVTGSADPDWLLLAGRVVFLILLNLAVASRTRVEDMPGA